MRLASAVFSIRECYAVSLVPCVECSHMVAKNARRCPNCGGKPHELKIQLANGTAIYPIRLAIAAIVLFFVYAIYSHY